MSILAPLSRKVSTSACEKNDSVLVSSSFKRFNKIAIFQIHTKWKMKNIEKKRKYGPNAPSERSNYTILRVRGKLLLLQYWEIQAFPSYIMVVCFKRLPNLWRDWLQEQILNIQHQSTMHWAHSKIKPSNEFCKYHFLLSKN